MGEDVLSNSMLEWLAKLRGGSTSIFRNWGLQADFSSECLQRVMWRGSGHLTQGSNLLRKQLSLPCPPTMPPRLQVSSSGRWQVNMVAERFALGLVVDENDGVCLALFVLPPTPGEQWQRIRVVLAHLEVVGWNGCPRGGPCMQFWWRFLHLTWAHRLLASDFLFSRAGALGKADPVAEMVKMLLSAFIFMKCSVTRGRSPFIFVPQFLYL